MLTHPTVDKLHQLRCAGMAKALAEQLGSPEIDALAFEERLGLIVDRELTERHSRQLTNRLRRARLRHAACIEDIDFRQPRGLDRDLVLSRADGRYAKLLASIAKTPVLVIDDWGVSKLSAENRRDLLEIIEDRHGLSSTIVNSQLPVKSWHAVIGDPTLADAILDRLVHNAYQLNLKGESMRKTHRPLNQTDHFTP